MPDDLYADATDLDTVLVGQRLYKIHCAACHGRNLQGQALWRMNDEHAGERAPGLDPSGHAWQHSDEALVGMVATGRFEETSREVPSHMPAFAGRLSPQEILATVAFLKSRWGTGLRAAQATLNPGWRGMPEDAAEANWTFPPTCTSTQQRWRSTRP